MHKTNREGSSQVTQDHTDVRHRVLVHPPIHVIRFLHISDKLGRWTASLGASQRSNEACVASGFLTGFSEAKAEGSEANAGAEEHPIAPRKDGDNPEVFVCQDSQSVTWWLGGGAGALYPDLL